MSNPKKIIDNSSSAELLKQIQAFESLEALYKAIPFVRKLFPGLEKKFADFEELKKQLYILRIPDRFNECFASLGWIAYESMNLEVMKDAISIYELQGEEHAEIYLADSYNEDCLKFNIQRFNGNKEFKKRVRLSQLAKDDYLAGRYHACTPLLLSLLDGLVNDVSKHVGFFADSADLTAWDCIAAHESGLQAISSLMTKGRNKTNESPITIPFRNGILHGRELAFDNKIVAAKCWAALFASYDWAIAISNGKKTASQKPQASWKELFTRIIENDRQTKLLESWKPRSPVELSYLPHYGRPEELPAESPERAVAEFMENWRLERYGLLADSLLYFIDTPKKKKAGLAKEDFSLHIPSSFTVISVEDQAPAASHVIVNLDFHIQKKLIQKQVSVRVIYQDEKRNLAIRSSKNGQWKVVQNSLSKILYNSAY